MQQEQDLRRNPVTASQTMIARSAVVFAFYALLVGIGFLLIPGPILTLVRMPATDDVYPRAIGALIIAIAAYYYVAGRRCLIPFIQASVFGRGFFVLCLVAMVFLGPSRYALLLFAGLDTAGLIWSALALRRAGLPLFPDMSQIVSPSPDVRPSEPRS